METKEQSEGRIKERDRWRRMILEEIACSQYYQKRWAKRVDLLPSFPQDVSNQQAYGFECQASALLSFALRMLGDRKSDLQAEVDKIVLPVMVNFPLEKPAEQNPVK